MIIVTIYWNVQLTPYDCQSRMKKGHGVISIMMVTFISMPEHTTYFL